MQTVCRLVFTFSSCASSSSLFDAKITKKKMAAAWTFRPNVDNFCYTDSSLHNTHTHTYLRQLSYNLQFNYLSNRKTHSVSAVSPLFSHTYSQYTLLPFACNCNSLIILTVGHVDNDSNNNNVNSHMHSMSLL